MLCACFGTRLAGYTLCKRHRSYYKVIVPEKWVLNWKHKRQCPLAKSPGLNAAVQQNKTKNPPRYLPGGLPVMVLIAQACIIDWRLQLLPGLRGQRSAVLPVVREVKAKYLPVSPSHYLGEDYDICKYSPCMKQYANKTSILEPIYPCAQRKQKRPESQQKLQVV